MAKREQLSRPWPSFKTSPCTAKKEFDPDLGAFTLSKSLILGLSYPYDWGFIPSTEGEDGDPLDALVLHDAAMAPGLVLKCKIIGVLQIQQREAGKAEDPQ